LVQNVLSYDLLVTPKLAKIATPLALCQILEITKEEFLRKMKKACQAPNSPRKESIFEKQLSNKVYAALTRKIIPFQRI
jgi:penicillin-binding protein 2